MRPKSEKSFLQLKGRKRFKKTLMVFLAFLTLIFITFGDHGFQKVSISATSVTVCKPSGCDYTEIQAAINFVESKGGGTVNVKAGSYLERLTLKSKVSVVGEGSGTTVLGGPSVGPNNEKVTGASNAVLSKISINGGTYGIYNSGVSPKIDNCLVTGALQDGIYNTASAAPEITNSVINTNVAKGINNIGAGDSIKIHKNRIYSNGTSGINHENTKGIIYQNEIYQNTQQGIMLKNSGAYVFKNIVKGPSQSIGIKIEGGNPVIADNIIGLVTEENNSYGLQVITSPVTDLFVVGNTFSSNGVNLSFSPVGNKATINGNYFELSQTSNISLSDGTYQIEDNVIKTSGSGVMLGHGIYLSGTAVTANILKNVLTENGVIGGRAISDSSCNGTTVLYNLIYDNHNEGYFAGTATCSNSKIENNVFDKNGSDGIYTGTVPTLTIKHNQITNNAGRGIHGTVAATGNSYNNVYNNTAGNFNGWVKNATDILSNPYYLKDNDPKLYPSFALQSSSEGYGSSMSASIDKAEPIPAHEDKYRPPGRGAIRGDLGAYGGDLPVPTAKVTNVKVEGKEVADGGEISLGTATPKITGLTGQDLLDAGKEVRVYFGGQRVGVDADLDFNCSNPSCVLNNGKKSSFEIITNDLGVNGAYLLKIVVVDKLGLETEAYTVTVNLTRGVDGGGGGTNIKPITDLKIINYEIKNSSVELTFTAPKDLSGNKASEYDIRYSHSYLTDKTWDQATNIKYNLTPKSPGSKEKVVVLVNASGTVGSKSDIDEDGLTDYMETILYGTSAVNQDTDGDKYHDGTETYYKYSPLFPYPYKPDRDGDGLNDDWEIKHGLDETKADTDGDGYFDKVELDNKYDPRNAHPRSYLYDLDHDGLTDHEERYIFRTNPASEDSDNDGYEDFIEVHSGYDPVKMYYFGIRSVDSTGKKSEISNRVWRYVY